MSHAWRLAGLSAAVLAVLTACKHGPAREFPLGIYGVPKADLRLVRQAGFNLVTGPAQKDYLNAAHDLGLRVLASPGTSAGTTFQADRARRAVQQFDSHPALWAWYLVDEPDLNGVSPDAVRQAQRFLKNSGAHKPTALVLYQGGAALDFGNIADITMVDRYPVPWLPLANFPQHVRMVRLALGPKKPLVAVVQAFDWQFYPKLLQLREPPRAPTDAELRCMTYSALARRANGIFYYCFDDKAWQMKRHPEIWHSLTSLVAEVSRRLPLFQAEHQWWPYIHEYLEPARGFNAALETSVIPALLRVKNGNENVPKGDYLLAVNTSDRRLAYRITLPANEPPFRDHHASERKRGNRSPGAPPSRPLGPTAAGPATGPAEITVLDEARAVPVAGGWLQDEFGPFDVHIYGPIFPR